MLSEIHDQFLETRDSYNDILNPIYVPCWKQAWNFYNKPL